MSDLHQVFDAACGAFVAITIAEVIVKPVAIRVGKLLLRKADEKLEVIPDFLYDEGGIE